MPPTERRPTKRELFDQQLASHYAALERLASALGGHNPSGKKLSLALYRLEKAAHAASLARCNGESMSLWLPGAREARELRFRSDQCEADWDWLVNEIKERVTKLFGKLPPGFFVNGDPRGYALKLDPDAPQIDGLPSARSLIESARLHRDWGGYGILSPEIERP